MQFYIFHILDNVQNVFIAQAHRGRLNMLTCQLGFPPVVMFRKVVILFCKALLIIHLLKSVE